MLMMTTLNMQSTIVLATNGYEDGILKFVDRHDECLNVRGDYLEK